VKGKRTLAPLLSGGELRWPLLIVASDLDNVKKVVPPEKRIPRVFPCDRVRRRGAEGQFNGDNDLALTMSK
jgi:hypothetical protein